MTPADLRAILSRLGLPQTGLAHILGVEPRTVRRWIAGDIPIPELVARVLRAAERGAIRLDDLR